MQQYAQGEAAAFDVLYQRHRGSLYRYLLRHCGHAGVAEELVQEVWVGVIRQRAGYTVQARFTTWLYHMAHGRLVDHYRQQTRTPLAVLDEDDFNSAQEALPVDSGLWPDRQAERHRMAQRLRGLISKLPPAQREAYLLHEEAGLDLAQIAEVTGNPRETVKSRLRYAVARLREGLRT